MSTAETARLDDRLLLLHPNDDCVVARVKIPAGTTLRIDDAAVTLEVDLGVGHKLARRALAAGAVVHKCGAAIGTMSEAAAIGDRLHLHNLESTYLPAHLVGGRAVSTHPGASHPETSHPGTGHPGTDASPREAFGAGEVAAPANVVSVAAVPDLEEVAVPAISGFLRADGRKGIRNHLLVVYTVECAHHVVARIADAFEPTGESGVQVVGFPGCYPNEHAQRILAGLCTHPNVGGALLVSLGCESFDAAALLETVRASGRWAARLTIQEDGGTTATIATGRELVRAAQAEIGAVERAPMGVDELVVGTICGGSDSTSVLTANPAVGRAFDRLVAAGATCIFEETGELIGCEESLRRRGVDPSVGDELAARVAKAAAYYDQLGHASIAPGNLAGGLTTIEEKSVGAYAKSGSAPIAGVIEPGEVVPGKGLYLLDVVPDGPALFGYPNINDTSEIVELIACGSHVVVFTTGRGSVVGSVISPVVKVCANPETYQKMADDMDVDAGRVLLGAASLDEVGREIYAVIARTASGQPTRSEALGHQEFQLGYKVFRSLEPSCLA